jgi:transposase
MIDRKTNLTKGGLTMANYNRDAIKFYCGVDLHKKKSYLYVIDINGDKVSSKEIATTQKDFETFFSPYVSSGILVAVEISSLTFWLCDVLYALGVEVYVVNTLENHYLSRSVKKTDKEDARKLAIQLWKDILPCPVYIPKKEERDLRRLVSQRHSLVKSVTRVMNRTGHMLANYEIKFSRRALAVARRWQQLHESFEAGQNPVKVIRLTRSPRSRVSGVSTSQKGNLTERVLEENQVAQVDPMLLGEFALQYDQFKLFKDQIATVEKSLQSHFDQTPRLNAMYQLLLTIPGMGPITSSALIGCIGDINRFGSGRQMVSYLGLCPKVRESAGKSLSSGGITKRGNSRLRGYFVQAAVALLSSRNSKAQPLKEWYERIRRKKGWRTARIALARKLGLIAFGVLKTNTPYDAVKVTKKKVTVTDTEAKVAKAEPNKEIKEVLNT